ncbi:serine/threonine-protein kinase Pink1, mitochondrial-like isoform X2 [Uloborus diversus]|uniref:serine/threonine-protein kinase Pink1, mitochondrial-like isoform X2 n=1 Tax=Uloborus diversus TaxID=327109 RepID=UPI002409E642|nr:serine/threonine-protein kinase Pink1, mitochondrial-like isoform X2 [Uloborus diversus]
MGLTNQFVKSFYSVRSHLVPDSAKQSSLHSLLENVILKTREFFGVANKKCNLPSGFCRYQYKLPVEYFPNVSTNSAIRKSKFISYRPGFIQKVTSKWVVNSLAKNASKNILHRKGPFLCFVGFALAKKPSLLTADEEIEGISFKIRDAFSTLPWQIDTPSVLKTVLNGKDFTFEDLKIGKLLAKGSNAAVYSACLEPKETKSESENKEQKLEKSFSELFKDNLMVNSRVIISHSEDIAKTVMKKENLSHLQNYDSNDLAVKVMFNYSAESNAFAIWRAMYKESLPSISELSLGDFARNKIRKKHLKPHPNIVEMYFAFANQLPLLPGAFENYPQALPQRLLDDGCGRNMTLFLVMKRYHCSLKDYLEMSVSTQTALLLLTQLLEALAYLLKNGISHRDLKTDNILLDLNYGINSPRLVLTDFGCCSESLKLAYYSNDVGKDGNMALMAPEIINAEPGPFSVLDYSRADLWTAGTLAYEIFGEKNPFYSSNSLLRNDSYDWQKLPPLPSTMPTPIQKLVKDMLQVDPNKRPSPSFAATVCQLFLHAPSELLESLFSKKTSKKALEWMFKMSAETYLEASLKNSKEYAVALLLKHTWCSRIQFLEILHALKYIAE